MTLSAPRTSSSTLSPLLVDSESAQVARDQVDAFGFTDEEREALDLWMIEGLSLNQIGEQMNRSKNTIKARLTTAAERMSLTFQDLEARRELRKGAS